MLGFEAQLAGCTVAAAVRVPPLPAACDPPPRRLPQIFSKAEREKRKRQLKVCRGGPRACCIELLSRHHCPPAHRLPGHLAAAAAHAAFLRSPWVSAAAAVAWTTAVGHLHCCCCCLHCRRTSSAATLTTSGTSATARARSSSHPSASCPPPGCGALLRPRGVCVLSGVLSRVAPACLPALKLSRQPFHPT